MTEIENLVERARRESLRFITRRDFLKDCSLGLGAMALSGLLPRCGSPTDSSAGLADLMNPLAPKAPHFPGKAKAVIYLHMAGAPSQLDLFDYKPDLFKLDGQACPQSFLEGKRFAFIRAVPKMLGPQAAFKKRRAGGASIFDLC